MTTWKSTTSDEVDEAYDQIPEAIVDSQGLAASARRRLSFRPIASKLPGP